MYQRRRRPAEADVRLLPRKPANDPKRLLSGLKILPGLSSHENPRTRTDKPLANLPTERLAFSFILIDVTGVLPLCYVQRPLQVCRHFPAHTPPVTVGRPRMAGLLAAQGLFPASGNATNSKASQRANVECCSMTRNDSKDRITAARAISYSYLTHSDEAFQKSPFRRAATSLLKIPRHSVRFRPQIVNGMTRGARRARRPRGRPCAAPAAARAPRPPGAPS